MNKIFSILLGKKKFLEEKMIKKLLAVVMLVVLFAVGAASCAPAAAPAAPAEKAPAEAAPAEAEVMQEKGMAAGDIKLGYVVHIAGIPFCQQMIAGAVDAGKDLGIDVEPTGPSGLDAQAQIAMFNALETAGKNGIATVPYPAEDWVVPMENAMKEGILVSTMNVLPVAGTDTLFVGHDTFAGGVKLGEYAAEALKDKTGTVVIGIAVPGAPPLEDRANGIISVLKEYSQFTIEGPFDVGQDPIVSYDNWQTLYNKYPDAIAFLGVSAPDIPNLSKIRERAGEDFFVGGFDLEPETLTAIKNGFAEVTIGQHPYLQGYLPILGMAQALLEGKPMLTGWIDVGSPVVDKNNIDEIMAVESDPKALYDYYNKLIKAEYSDLASIAKPFFDPTD